MIHTKIRNLEARYKRFMTDIALVFLFDVLGLIFLAMSVVTPVSELFLIVSFISIICIGFSFGLKVVIFHRVVGRVKWKGR